jgi:hypothetical protein
MSKNKFVKYASFAAALLFAMAAATPANAKAWTPTSGQTLTDGKYMANTAEDTASSQTYSLVYNESRNDAICQTIGEGSCSATDTISGTYVLGVCTSAADSICIDQVTIFAQGASTPAPASVIRQIKAPVVNVASTSAATIPNGGATTLYRGSVNHAGGAPTYAVTAAVNVNFKGGKLTADDYSVAVTPYNEVRGGFVGPAISAGQINDYSQPECAFLEDGICGEVENFSANTRVSVSVRLPRTAYSFLGGRMTNADLAVAKAGTGLKVTVSGNPVSVQQLELALDPANTPAGLGIRKPAAKQTKHFSSLAAINTARAILGNKASGTRTFWQFSNWDGGLVANSLASTCASTSGIRGLFATDAIVTDGFVPARSGGSMKVNLNGVLNNPDGKADAGSVDVIFDAGFAKCALGKTSGVAVTVGASGKGAGFATSSSKSGSWLKASAKNLKYSSIVAVSVK